MNGLLPEPIKNRMDKMGYVTPNNRWIRDMKEEVRDYFTDDLSDFLNVKAIQKDFDQLFDLKTDTENYRTWKFINFAVWMKVYGM